MHVQISELDDDSQFEMIFGSKYHKSICIHMYTLQGYLIRGRRLMRADPVGGRSGSVVLFCLNSGISAQY
jgi:hypothetical protein